MRTLLRALPLFGVLLSAPPRAWPARRVQSTAIEVRPSQRHRVDLSGMWGTGTGPEPRDARIVVHPACNWSTAAWVIEQRGSRIEAYFQPASRGQGISVRPEDRQPVNTALGRLSGSHVVIQDGDVRYLLKYDSRTGHLHGTRAGEPFWAIRMRVVMPEGCRAIP